jgi:hypothetical protein
MAAILSRYQTSQSARLSINVPISKEKWSLDVGFRTNTRAAMSFRERTSIGTPKFSRYLRRISLVFNKYRPSIESPWGRHPKSNKFKGLQECESFFISARSKFVQK